MLDTLDLAGRRLVVDRAVADDVPGIVALLADDELGAHRERQDLAAYREAFAAIHRDPAHLVVVVRDGTTLAATVHLTLLPGLSRGATTRLQIEAVRVAAGERGSGLGRALLTWVLAWGEEHGAGLAQLTSDGRRTDAIRFYESLGFLSSHVGFKKELP